MLSSLLKSLISLKVHTRSKKVATYVFQETNNYQRQGRYEDFYTDNVSPFGCRTLQWNMYITMQYDTVVCNNAVPYRSSHHLPVTVERNTHTQSNARTLHLKWSVLALHKGNTLICSGYKGEGFLSLSGILSIQIYWKKRKFLRKTTVQLQQDYTRRFGTPTWSPLYRQRWRD